MKEPDGCQWFEAIMASLRYIMFYRLVCTIVERRPSASRTRFPLRSMPGDCRSVEDVVASLGYNIVFGWYVP
jgi:hypothetical protein